MAELTEEQVEVLRSLSMEEFNARKHGDGDQAVGVGVLVSASPVMMTDYMAEQMNDIFLSKSSDPIHELIFYITRPIGVGNGKPKVVSVYGRPNAHDNPYSYSFLMFDVRGNRFVQLNKGELDHRSMIFAGQKTMSYYLKIKYDLAESIIFEGIGNPSLHLTEAIANKMFEMRHTRSGGHLSWVHGYWRPSKTTTQIGDISQPDCYFGYSIIPPDKQNESFYEIVRSGVLEDITADFFDTNNVLAHSPTFNRERELNIGAIVSLLGGEGGTIALGKRKNFSLPRDVTFYISKSNIIFVKIGSGRGGDVGELIGWDTTSTSYHVAKISLINRNTEPGLYNYFSSMEYNLKKHDAITLTIEQLRLTNQRICYFNGVIDNTPIPRMFVDMATGTINDGSAFSTANTDHIWTKLSMGVPNIRFSEVVIEIMNSDVTSMHPENDLTIGYRNSRQYSHSYIKYQHHRYNIHAHQLLDSGTLRTFSDKYTFPKANAELPMTVNDNIRVEVYGRKLNLYDVMQVSNGVAGLRSYQPLHFIEDRVPIGTTNDEPGFMLSYGLGVYSPYKGLYSKRVCGYDNEHLTIGSNNAMRAVGNKYFNSIGLEGIEVESSIQKIESDRPHLKGAIEAMELTMVGYGYGHGFTNHLRINDSTFDRRLYHGTPQFHHALYLGDSGISNYRNPSDSNNHYQRLRSALSKSCVHLQSHTYPSGIGSEHQEWIDDLTYSSAMSLKSFYIGQDIPLINSNHQVIIRNENNEYPLTYEKCLDYIDADQKTSKNIDVDNRRLYDTYNRLEIYHTAALLDVDDGHQHNEHLGAIYFVPYGKLEALRRNGEPLKHIYGYNQILFTTNITRTSYYGLRAKSYQEIYHYTKAYEQTVSGDILRTDGYGGNEPIDYKNRFVLSTLKMPGIICNYLDKVSSQRKLNNHFNKYSDPRVFTLDNNPLDPNINEAVNVLLKVPIAHRAGHHPGEQALSGYNLICRYKTSDGLSTPRQYEPILQQPSNERHIYLPLFYIATSHRTYIFNLDSSINFNIDLSKFKSDFNTTDTLVLNVALFAVNGDNNTIILQDSNASVRSSPYTNDFSLLKKPPRIRLILQNAQSVDNFRVNFSLLANVYPTEMRSNALNIRDMDLVKVHAYSVPTTGRDRPNGNASFGDTLLFRYEHDSAVSDYNDFGFREKDIVFVDVVAESVWGSIQDQELAEATYEDFVRRYGLEQKRVS